MSTPYVGIKRVSQQSRMFGNTAWLEKATEEAAQTESGESAEMAVLQTAPQPDAKLRLVQVLRDYAGIRAIQVGSFIMDMTDHVPTRHLVMAAHWLVAEWREEPHPMPLADMVAECLLMLEAQPEAPQPAQGHELTLLTLPELVDADIEQA